MQPLATVDETMVRAGFIYILSILAVTDLSKHEWEGGPGGLLACSLEPLKDGLHHLPFHVGAILGVIKSVLNLFRHAGPVRVPLGPRNRYGENPIED